MILVPSFSSLVDDGMPTVLPKVSEGTGVGLNNDAAMTAIFSPACGLIVHVIWVAGVTECILLVN